MRQGQQHLLQEPWGGQAVQRPVELLASHQGVIPDARDLELALSRSRRARREGEGGWVPGTLTCPEQEQAGQEGAGRGVDTRDLELALSRSRRARREQGGEGGGGTITAEGEGEGGGSIRAESKCKPEPRSQQ